MKHEIYSIKDTLTSYQGVFTMMNEASAVRAFSMLANDKNTTVGQNPGDHQLWHIGTWDDQTGKIEAIEPEYVTNAASCIKVNFEVMGDE